MKSIRLTLRLHLLQQFPGGQDRKEIGLGSLASETTQTTSGCPRLPVLEHGLYYPF